MSANFTHKNWQTATKLSLFRELHNIPSKFVLFSVEYTETWWSKENILAQSLATCSAYTCKEFWSKLPVHRPEWMSSYFVHSKSHHYVLNKGHSSIWNTLTLIQQCGHRSGRHVRKEQLRYHLLFIFKAQLTPRFRYILLTNTVSNQILASENCSSGYLSYLGSTLWMMSLSIAGRGGKTKIPDRCLNSILGMKRKFATDNER